MSHELPSSNDSVRVLPPTKITTLLQGNVPEQPKYYPEGTRGFYHKFARRDLITLIEEEKMVIVTPGVIDGRDLTELFHFAAASKKFGVDADDTQYDWSDLYKPSNKALLGRHRKIAGWSEYEPHRTRLLEVITRAYPHSRGDVKDVIAPVISLAIGTGGEATWSFAPVSSQSADMLLQRLPELHGNQDNLFTILGSLIVAAYSPEVTRTWAGSDGRRNYHHPVDGYPEGSQDMGSTQILPLSIGEASSLLPTPLVKNLVRFATSKDSQIKPAIPPKFTIFLGPRTPKRDNWDDGKPNQY